MIRITATIFLFTLLMNNTVNAQKFKTVDDSLAYSLGVLIANNLRQEGFGDLDVDMISAGLKSALKGEPTLLSPDQCNTIVREQSTARKAKQAGSVKEAGEKFLAANKSRPGVISLDNGLQYEIIKAGNGPKPKATDKVLVHYHGTLIDGTVFDSSVERGESISFPLNQVIKGWTEILQLMPVGSKWKVYIPYDLAYGDRGAGGAIKPYSALIFEIELLGIE
jgi:FKBP-type peptidyl-prolyl cis-trans isomerase FklB